MVWKKHRMKQKNYISNFEGEEKWKLNIRKSQYGFSANYGADKTDGTKVYGYVQVGFRKDNEPKITENQNARIFYQRWFFEWVCVKRHRTKTKTC